MYTYTHTHTHTHTHTYTYIHTPVRIHAYIHTHMYAYTHTYMHTHTHVHIHTHAHTYTHTCTHTYIHTYIHTHVHIHTYIHTHRRVECLKVKVVSFNGIFYETNSFITFQLPVRYSMTQYRLCDVFTVRYYKKFKECFITIGKRYYCWRSSSSRCLPFKAWFSSCSETFRNESTLIYY